MTEFWTPALVRDLLRSPQRLLASPTNRAQIEAYGGLAQIHALVQQQPLPPHLQALLRLLLEAPLAPRTEHAEQLSIHRATYHRQVQTLYELLAVGLNRHAPGLPPALPAPELPPHQPSLPVALNDFIGRTVEQRELTRLLAMPDLRIMTLTGTGGIGKTRLALQVAADWCRSPGRMSIFVPLADLTDAAQVLSALSHHLALNALPQGSLLEAIRRAIAPQTLLIFDNAEHLPMVAGELAALVQAVPAVRLLVTSRTRLNLPGEHVLVVPPLPGVPAGGTPQDSDAVQLFLRRAEAHAAQLSVTPSTMSEIAALCERLEGVPLAIELAAARARLLQPGEILRWLDPQLTLLEGDPAAFPPRQRTVRATLEWSYGLLAPAARQLLACLSLFAGSWTLEAALAIIGPSSVPAMPLINALTALLDASLVARQPGLLGETRFTMLEMVRIYAAEQLALLDAAQALAARHGRFYAELSLAAATQFGTAQQGDWLNRLDADAANLQAALAWAVDQRELELARNLLAALWQWWHIRGYGPRGQVWLQRILAVVDPEDRATQAQLWMRAGILHSGMGAIHEAYACFVTSTDLWQQCGNLEGMGVGLSNRGLSASMLGRYAEAEESFNRSLAIHQERADPWWIAMCQTNLMELFLNMERVAEAQAVGDASLALWQTLGDTWGIATIQHHCGQLAFLQAATAQALQVLETALAAALQLGDHRLAAMCRTVCGQVLLQQGAPDAARRWLQLAITALAELGDLENLIPALEALALVVIHEGNPIKAVRIISWTTALREVVGRALHRLERRIYDPVLQRTQIQLKAHLWQAAWQQGAELPLTQAVALILAEPG